MKAFKAFIKPFESTQRSVKIKISINFFSSSRLGREELTGSLNSLNILSDVRATTPDIRNLSESV